ncbi:hypothetical protein [Bradyrhizobium sp. USDA 3650]
MTRLYLSRKLCPKCGKPMTAVLDDVGPGRSRYVCLVCEGDPLRFRRPEVGGSRRALPRRSRKMCVIHQIEYPVAQKPAD